MSRATSAGSYRAVLLMPHALSTFVPALAGRLAYGLFPLATLFTIHEATGSYATAGAAVAAFGLASITLPAKARLSDRYGRRRTLPPLALLCAVALAAAAFVTGAVALIALITVAGLAAPPLGAAMRSTWRLLTEGTTLKPRAYALDSIAEETLYLAGPLVAGLLVAVGPPRWALLATAALLLGGTLGMVATPPARHREPATGGHPFGVGPLRSGGLRTVLAVVLVASVGVSVAYTCMAAFAQNEGRPGAAGLIEAAIGLGSVTGGLLWARRHHTRGWVRHLAWLITVLAAGSAAAAAAPGLVSLGVVMGLTGVAIAPLFVVAYLAADDLAPPGAQTEATTWVNVAANAGNAGGAALAGVVTQAAGTGRGFLAGALLLAATAAILLASTSRPVPAQR
jgi:predicted MFS family arabinose efflux permease